MTERSGTLAGPSGALLAPRVGPEPQPYQLARTSTTAPPSAAALAPGALTTTAGDPELGIPKLRAGSSFPSVLVPSPDPEAPLRLVGAVLVEAHDGWQVSDRRYFSGGSMAAIRPIDKPASSLAPPARLAA